MMSGTCRGLVALAIVCSGSLLACGDSGATSGGGGSGTTGSGAGGADPFAACSKGALEADGSDDVAMTGPGVDPKTGALAPGHYVIASTYLALVPEQAAHAQDLGSAVVATLPKMKGLVAFGLRSSQSCVALRTLTVWTSEDDMMAFVMSPAHAKAMVQASTLSRGSSNIVSWEGNEDAASWKEAAAHLAHDTGADL